MQEKRKGIKDNIYIQLFIEFFTLGLFTFGGGYAMIGLLEDRMRKRGWLESEEILDCIAVTQTLPGVIAVNMSVYVGYRMKGIKGALVSVFGMVLPSFVIIIMIAMFMENFGDNRYIQGALKGIRIATTGLILSAALRLAGKTFDKVKGKKADTALSVILFLVSFLLISFMGVDALWMILSGIVIGIIYSLLMTRRAAS